MSFHFDRIPRGSQERGGVVMRQGPKKTCVRASRGEGRVTRPDINKTLCPSGLRGWTQVPLAQAAWVQIPQLSSENFVLALAQKQACFRKHKASRPPATSLARPRGFRGAGTASSWPSNQPCMRHAYILALLTCCSALRRGRWARKRLLTATSPLLGR